MTDQKLEGIADIARELFETEHDRLMVDHYDDDVNSSCDGCRRASLIAIKLDRGIAFVERSHDKAPATA